MTTQPLPRASTPPLPSQGPSSQPQQRNKGSPSKTSKGNYPACRYQCKLCSNNHYVFACSQFLDMTVAQRKDHVKANSLCPNCLKPGHSLTDCRSEYRCRLCKGNHNSLIHQDSTSSNPQTVTGTANVANASPSSTQAEDNLMMTSQVLLIGPSGKKLVVRALLDCGVNTSIISSKVMKSLGLKKLDACVTLAGIESPDNTPAHPTAQVTLSSPCRK